MPRRSLLTTVLIIFTITVIVRVAWMSDDAFITLRTVDNFVHGYGLRWNVAERVQSYTHPLWMMLMTVVYAISREPYYTVIALSIAVSAIVVVWLVRLAPGPGAEVWAVAALTGSKAFVDYCTSGLENPLTHLLLIAFFLAWRRERAAVTTVWFLAALLWLNRFDLGLIAMPALLVRWRDVTERWRAVAIGVAPAVAWALFALIYYGTVAPNTAYAKLQTGVSEAEMVKQGLIYLLNSINLDPLTLMVIALGLVVSFEAPRRDWVVPAGMLLYLAYVVAIGGDFMSGRMLTPVFVLAVLQVLTQRRDRQTIWATAAVVTVAISVSGGQPPLLFDARDVVPPDTVIEPSGIADERQIYHQQGMGLLLTKRETPARHPFVKLGLDARSGPRVVSAFTIGMMGYYAGPAIHIVDTIGLSDPLLARLPSDPGWRIGHYFRDIPDGYMETLATGRNVIRDARIAMLYDKIALVTRAPIWNAKRLSTILSLNTGEYRALAKAEAP